MDGSTNWDPENDRLATGQGQDVDAMAWLLCWVEQAHACIVATKVLQT
jgi:hypothetical protein